MFDGIVYLHFFLFLFLFAFLCMQFFADLNYKLDSPWKLISLLGWMIWPRNGKNTNGIFSDDDPLTNGASVHSVNKQTNKILRKKKIPRESKWKRNRNGFFIIEYLHRPYECMLIHFHELIFSVHLYSLGMSVCDNFVYCHTLN